MIRVRNDGLEGFDLNELVSDADREAAQKLMDEAKEKAEKLGIEVTVPDVTKAGEPVTVSPEKYGPPTGKLSSWLVFAGIAAAILGIGYAASKIK